jgi:hypothetical protein
VGAAIPEVQQTMAQRYPRPHIFGEFGCHVAFIGERLKWDPTGIHLHDGLWASALSGSAGTVLTWWWDNYVHNTGQYRHFPPLARFCESIPWTTAGFQEARAGFRWLAPPPPPSLEDLVIEPESHWDILESRFVAERDGTVRGKATVSECLHGSNHAKLRKPLVFVVDYPQPGKFMVHVHRVQVLGILEIRRDGEVVLHKELPVGPEPGTWKTSHIVESGLWKWREALYDQDFAIDVPAGKHEIRLDNLGKDAILLGAVTLTKYQRHEEPPLRCVGLTGRHLALLWIQNTAHDWSRVLQGRTVPPVEGVELSVATAADGPCRIQWWDTWEGNVVSETTAQANAGKLAIPLPRIATDAACKLGW